MARLTLFATTAGSTGALFGCAAGGGIDPVAVAAALKGLCGIAVDLATIITVINSIAGATLQGVVDLICSGFHSAVAAQAQAGVQRPTSGMTVNFVVVAGGKQVPITATVL